MKKRILMIIALVLTVAVCLSFAACGQTQGKSAYDIACENGFVGSQQEWLDSLRGADGQDGIGGADGQNATTDIYDLYASYLKENEGATFSDFLQSFSLPGANNAEYAAAIGIQSTVSVFSTFATQEGGQGVGEYSGAGSGVAYRKQGGVIYIITNYHVVYDSASTTAGGIAKSIELYSYGQEYMGRGVPAEYVGGSPTKDIAVIKAEASAFFSDILPARIGDSNTLALGEKVVAIGNPSGKGTSVSAGVISMDSENIDLDALDDSGEKITMRVIRTDTAINRGNSGGGLFNMRGELVGIVNAKTIQSGVENIGYAIPISIAFGVADSILYGDGVKCFIGVTVTIQSTKTKYNSAENRVEIVDTLVIQSVMEDVLAVGKLLQDDRLVSVRINSGDTFELTRLFHLSDYLYNVRRGDTIYLGVERGGSIITVELAPQSSDFLPV